MNLIRCTPENGHFLALRAQWREVLTRDDSAPEELYTPHLEYAERVAAEQPPKPSGGVYTVMSPDGEHHALLHMNYAWAIKAVRVVWHYLSPKYVDESASAIDIAPVMGAILRGAWGMYRGEWAAAEELKIYCQTREDRMLFETAIAYLAQSGIGVSSRRGGNWLHVTAVDFRA